MYCLPLPQGPTLKPKPRLAAYAQCGGKSGGGGGPYGDFAFASRGGRACALGYGCIRTNEWCASQLYPQG